LLVTSANGKMPNDISSLHMRSIAVQPIIAL
jgi:hypothetical protein